VERDGGAAARGAADLRDAGALRRARRPLRAVVTSFFGAQAFARAAVHTTGIPPLHVISYTSGAIALFALVAILTLGAQLPYGVRFSISAERMFEEILARADSDPVGAKEAFRVVAAAYEELYDANRAPIRVLGLCYRAATLFLMGEVVLWIVVLGRGRL
jgi:hypothetical protein